MLSGARVPSRSGGSPAPRSRPASSPPRVARERPAVRGQAPGSAAGPGRPLGGRRCPLAAAAGTGAGVALGTEDAVAAATPASSPDAEEKADDSPEPKDPPEHKDATVGLLLGHRIIRRFGHRLFLGTVVRYKPCTEGSAIVHSSVRPNVRFSKEGNRNKHQKLDYGAYRVIWDDGDVLDFCPDEIYRYARLYHMERQRRLENESQRKRGGWIVLGTDQFPRSSSRKQEAPSPSADAGERELRRHANPPLSGLRPLRLLDEERLAYWLQFEAFHTENGVARPSSLVRAAAAGDEQVGWAEEEEGGAGGTPEDAHPGILAAPLAPPQHHCSHGEPPDTVKDHIVDVGGSGGAGTGPAQAGSNLSPEHLWCSPSVACEGGVMNPPPGNNGKPHQSECNDPLMGFLGATVEVSNIGDAAVPLCGVSCLKGNPNKVCNTTGSIALGGGSSGLDSGHLCQMEMENTGQGKPEADEIALGYGSRQVSPRVDTEAQFSMEERQHPEERKPIFPDDRDASLPCRRDHRVGEGGVDRGTISNEAIEKESTKGFVSNENHAVAAVRSSPKGRSGRCKNKHRKHEFPATSDDWIRPKSDIFRNAGSNIDSSDSTTSSAPLPLHMRVLTLGDKGSNGGHQLLLSVCTSTIPNAGRGLFLTYQGPLRTWKAHGCVDLGRYGPHCSEDIKPDFLMMIKNFLYEDRPSEWSFNGPPRSQEDSELILFGKHVNQDVIFDITSDDTGQLRGPARDTLLPFVNEVTISTMDEKPVGKGRGGKRNMTQKPKNEQNVDAIHHDDGSLHYLLREGSLFKRGEKTELLVYYGEDYDSNRHRKTDAYGMTGDGHEKTEIGFQDFTASGCGDGNDGSLSLTSSDRNVVSGDGGKKSEYTEENEHRVKISIFSECLERTMKRSRRTPLSLSNYTSMRRSIFTYTEQDVEEVLDMFLSAPPISSLVRQRMWWVVDQLQKYWRQFLSSRRCGGDSSLPYKIGEALELYPREDGPHCAEDEDVMDAYQYVGCAVRKLKEGSGFKTGMVEKLLEIDGATPPMKRRRVRWYEDDKYKQKTKYLVVYYSGEGEEVMTEEEVEENFIDNDFGMMG